MWCVWAAICLVAVGGASAQDFDRAVTDVAARAEAVAKAFEAEAKKQPSVKAMMDEVAQKNEVDDRAIQSALLAEALLGAGEEFACPACEKDYSAACPEEWLQLRHGACLAPAGYRGCEGVGFLNAYSDADKRDFETRCGVCWPCKNGAAFMARRVGIHQGAADLPLDLPKELVADVNKAPYPVVNIIADQSVGSLRAEGAMVQRREAERARQAGFWERLARQDAAFEQALGKQEGPLRRLAVLAQRH